MLRFNLDISTRWIASSGAACVLAIGALSYAQSDPKPSAALKVCADPDNLPQSDQNGAGYENELARALARDLGKRLQYTYFPQRMGFVRNTLKGRDETGEFKCDLILGVPVGFDPAATTHAYMRSTYALIVPARAKLGTLTDPNQLLQLPKQRLQSLRFGVFSKSPATDWLLRNGLIDRATFYASQSGDVAEHPAAIIERELSRGAIDVAIVWGPVAGYLASRHAGPDKWTAVPFKPDPEIRFDYEIAMGVRFGEKEWKSKLDRWIAGHRSEIDRILSRYQVPLLALSTPQ
ncbi:MAG TPA: quinoprotein dehydrogenase-associated putative ABC transporter substrate-binding protein [Polyangiales bacterium]|nr:quinoprotein dehydrogenase-associated putative ABC transporter substrate-binding protein [Polyangiales bacterium]